MEILDRETQMTAVAGVLEEMQKAEEYVKSWNVGWYEQLSDAYCLPLHTEVGEADIRELEDKYKPRYKLANAFYFGDSIGIPLAKETLVGFDTLTEKSRSFTCEFGRIEWFGMDTRNATRHFSFCNNGSIEFSKSAKIGKIQTSQHPKRVSYETSFNVLSSDFDITITLDQLIDSLRNRHSRDSISLSLKDGVITERFNDIEIVRNFNTGMSSVEIVKAHDKQNNASVVLKASLNPDDSLKRISVEIITHKKNGKVNGTYRFDASREKGLRAYFYSRKGLQIDLTSDPALLSAANALLLPAPDHQNRDEMIIPNFANSTRTTMAKSLSERVVSFDESDFNMEAVLQAETTIMETIKEIKGELPLPRLVERIDNYLSLMNKGKRLQFELPNH